MVAGPSPESHVSLQSWHQSSSRVEFKLTVVNGRGILGLVDYLLCHCKKKKVLQYVFQIMLLMKNGKFVRYTDVTWRIRNPN